MYRSLRAQQRKGASEAELAVEGRHYETGANQKQGRRPFGE